MAVILFPFNGAGSHLPSWNSKLLGRERRGEEEHARTHTHTHTHTHASTDPTSVLRGSLGLETLLESTSPPLPGQISSLAY